MIYGEFTATPLNETISYAQIAEGHYLTAGPEAQYDYLVTLGLYTCKAITLHNRTTGKGVLAHVDGTTRLASVLGTTIEAYEDDPSTADIKIVQAEVSEDNYLWPSIESIADFYMQYNPRTLLLDKNPMQLSPRGIALNLHTGSVHETDYDSCIMQNSRCTLKPSLPLRKVYSE